MATLAQRLSDLAAAIRNKINLMVPRLIPSGGSAGQVLAKSTAVDYAVGWVSPGGGADPWTRIGLAADFVNATVAFTDITGMSFTPPANTNWTLEAEMLIQTPLTTNLPRLGVSVGAGQAYWAGEIGYQSGAAAKVLAEAQGTTGAGSLQMAVGTAPVQGAPFLATVIMKGRSGATPGAIKLQLAAETAAANAALARPGSEMRTRTGP